MLPFRDYNPSRTFPFITVLIIAANVLVFLYMLSLQAEGPDVLEAFVHTMAVIPARLTHVIHGDLTPAGPAFLSLFTAMFLHAGPVHLLGNMLYLWIFGNNVEDIMGHGHFLVFYLLCGLIASIIFIAVFPDSTTPMLGASGAIAGVLGAYAVRFPFAQVDSCLFLFIFVTVIRLPAIVVLAFWFFLQLLNSVGSMSNNSSSQGGVAYWAHIGGFVSGMLLVTFFAAPRKRYYDTWTDE